jgi:hypothetical protein
MRRIQFSIARLMGIVLIICCGLASLRFASKPISSAILLLTFGILSTAILGVVYRQGSRRAFWLGFALFGWGYMALTSGFWWDVMGTKPDLVTTYLLDVVDPYLQVGPLVRLASEYDPRNRAILQKLEEPITMSFPTETFLEDVLKYIKAATRGPLDSGIPIHVDPLALRGLKKGLESTVTLELEGVPLRTSLSLMLEQLDLIYEVHNGVLIIKAGTPPDPREPVPSLNSVEYYHRIGHCYWTLLAGLLGGAIGHSFCVSRDRASRRAEDPEGEKPTKQSSGSTPASTGDRGDCGLKRM